MGTTNAAQTVSECTSSCTIATSAPTAAPTFAGEGQSFAYTMGGYSAADLESTIMRTVLQETFVQTNAELGVTSEHVTVGEITDARRTKSAIVSYTVNGITLDAAAVDALVVAGFGNIFVSVGLANGLTLTLPTLTVYSTTTVETSDDDDGFPIWIILVICGAALFIAVGVFVAYKFKTRQAQSLSDMDSGVDEKLVQPGVTFAEANSPQTGVDIEMDETGVDIEMDEEDAVTEDAEVEVEEPAGGNDVLVAREPFTPITA